MPCGSWSRRYLSSDSFVARPPLARATKRGPTDLVGPQNGSVVGVGLVQRVLDEPVSPSAGCDGFGSDWRRGRDSNPRSFRSTVFKTAAINRSATSPPPR